MRALAETRPGRATLAALAVVTVATIAAMIVMWPSGSSSPEIAGVATDTQRAEVVASQQGPCPGAPGSTCGRVEVELTEPAADGESRVSIDLGDTRFAPDVEVGDQVRVAQAETPEGIPASYNLTDFERRAPMLWLALAFVAIVLVFGRLRGALSLAGLALSLLIVVAFIVPAIRDGSEPVLVAVSGGFAVMLVTISLAHGLGVKSVAAMLGTTGSLIAVSVLALIFTELTNLTGFSTEEATLLAGDGTISVQGLLLAGMVIGALGVLDDVTVSQASTVVALRSASPAMGAGELYRRALEVGRDHISATVNTLVLAYVGAALPVLLIFSAGEVGFGAAINSEIVATEIVAMLVGSIGLIAAVPMTTGLAAALAVRLPPESLAGEAEHAHTH